MAEMRDVERDYREISKELTLVSGSRNRSGGPPLDGLARLTSALQ